MQIRLLGGVDAATDDGAPIDLGPAKCRAVLAALALSPGAAVPVPRLVELVWGEDPPRTAEKTLQSYVTRLRKALGADTIERTGAAYRLVVAATSVDVARFERLLAAGDVAAALQEWSGAPLAGLDAPGMVGTVDGLVERWLSATETDLGHQVGRDPGASVAILTELTAQYPFREGLWALLMTSLYRSGRQADALAAFSRARTHLVEELGIEPGPQLRELESQILGHDDRLRPSGPPAAPNAPTGTVTFAFSDIVESSRLWAEQRQRMATAVARHDDIVRAAAADHDGYVFATGGDSFGIAFHRAGDAASWADDVQRSIAAEAWPAGIDLRVRIGLHTGEAEERANDYFGPAVNIAARVAAAGHGGQVLASAVTTALVDADDPRDLGRYRFDGVGLDLHVFQLDDGDHAPLRTEETRKGNVPRRVGRLYGRDEELGAVAQAVAAKPIVTMVGPGGIGKTRLALAAARLAQVDVAGGAWLVELADVGSSADVARAVADVLDVMARAGQSLTDAIVSQLEPMEAVLVLDNCEHVVEGAAALAEAIARGCPDVSVLATSREGLGLIDEQLVVVGPLDPDGPAIELFEERARTADPSFDLATSRDAVAEICRRLDGVPLAIELAAARVRTLPPADLVDRLDDRLRLLTGGRRRSVERHRTLRATIQWSYDLLTESEQMLFRRLSIFSGSFDLPAAEAVVADQELPLADVNGLLGDLVERSMVSVESGAYGRRFRLLETMRQFAAEHLSAAGASGRVAERHAAYVGAEVARLGGLLTSNAEIEGAARLAELWPNLRAAVDWGLAIEDRELVMSLLRPIALQLFVRRDLGEICDWVERLLAITPPEDEEIVGWGLMWAGMHYSMNQDRDRYRQLVDECGNPDHLMAQYAHLFAIEDETFAALELGPQAIDAARAQGYESYARLFEVFTAAALMTAGSFEQARRKHEALAELFRAEGPPSFLNWTLYLLGATATFEGDHELADHYWEESTTIDLPPRTNSPNGVLSARAAFRRGRRHEAYRLMLGYVDELIEVDNLAGVAMVGMEFVNMMAAIDRPVAAGVIVGHFDATGLLAVEGPGFKLLIEDAVASLAADPDAAEARERAAAEPMDERGALAHMRDVLTELVSDQ